MIDYYWISSSLGIFIAGTILLLVRNDRLHTRHALWWLLVACIIGFLGVFPKLSDVLGELLNISYPPILPVIVGLCIVLVKALLGDIEHSNSERKLRRLAQQFALLEYKLRLLDRNSKH